jgi:hypothetical protein
MANLAKNTPGSTKAQNTKWFSSDIPFSGDPHCVLNYSVDTDVLLQITYDGGTNWSDVDSSQTSQAGKNKIFAFTMVSGELVNFRHTTAATITFLKCSVDQ